MATGFVRPLQQKATAPESGRRGPAVQVNTRHSLWQERWPAIALKVCIDKVEAEPPEKQAAAKDALPCSECSERSRCLNAKRKEIGPIMYDREILTAPRTGESSLFSREVFAGALEEELSLVPYWRPPDLEEHHFRVVQAWDLAWSERIGGDWLVCMTAYVDIRTGERTLLSIKRWRKIGFDDQVKLIEAEWRQFNASLVVIESDAAQSIWAKHVGANTPVPVLPHSAGGKGDFKYGVPGLLIKLANRKWRIPYRKGSLNHGEVENFLKECEAFTMVDGKLQGVGEHDDTVMAWWHLDWGIDRLVGGAISEHHLGVQPGAH